MYCLKAFPGKDGANDEEIKLNSLKELLGSKQYFIFPINCNQNHWFVVRGNMEKTCWEVHNSIPDPQATHDAIVV